MLTEFDPSQSHHDIPLLQAGIGLQSHSYFRVARTCATGNTGLAVTSGGASNPLLTSIIIDLLHLLRFAMRSQQWNWRCLLQKNIWTATSYHFMSHAVKNCKLLGLDCRKSQLCSINCQDPNISPKIESGWSLCSLLHPSVAHKEGHVSWKRRPKCWRKVQSLGQNHNPNQIALHDAPHPTAETQPFCQIWLAHANILCLGKPIPEAAPLNRDVGSTWLN